MAIDPKARKMTVEEYFELDGDPSAKYEYIDGYAVAMSGGSVGHARIAKNIVRKFDDHLQEGPCQTHTSDVKVLIATRGNYFYPDVAVSCDPNDNDINVQFVRSPRLIIEVLSPSTESKDRDAKFQQYQMLPSLQEYVLVSARYQFIECYRRQSDETWLYQAYRPDQLVEFKSLNVQLAFAEIYANVPVPAKFDLIKEMHEEYTTL
jgi:Uma2 family endonuclease